jgi:hypothetical protein
MGAEVLGHGEFRTSDHFFAIEGHSLAAARLVSCFKEMELEWLNKSQTIGIS